MKTQKGNTEEIEEAQKQRRYSAAATSVTLTQSLSRSKQDLEDMEDRDGDDYMEEEEVEFPEEVVKAPTLTNLEKLIRSDETLMGVLRTTTSDDPALAVISYLMNSERGLRKELDTEKKENSKNKRLKETAQANYEEAKGRANMENRFKSKVVKGVLRKTLMGDPAELKPMGLSEKTAGKISGNENMVSKLLELLASDDHERGPYKAAVIELAKTANAQ